MLLSWEQAIFTRILINSKAAEMHNRLILNTSESKVWLQSFLQQLKDLFTTPIASRQQMGVILFLALLYIFIPQRTPADWDLYNENFWSAGLNAYHNQSIVSPPWAFILMLPYYLMRAEGARVFSVLVIGWLSYQRSWSLSKFFAIALSPFFLVTMSKSNLDILVLVFPILLWEIAQGTRWQTIGRGIALSILLLKPQGALLIWIYLLWTGRDDWYGLVKPLLVVALLVIPISAIGSPPLILQWMNNLLHPSPQNEYYWSINNLSLSRYLSPLNALLVVIVSFSTMFSFMKWRRRLWSSGHTLASLLLVSMFLSPYASQQSFSSALAFIPSWVSFFTQSFVLFVSFKVLNYWENIPLLILLIGLVSLYFYQPTENTDQHAQVKVN
jgi:hypothetical protein